MIERLGMAMVSEARIFIGGRWEAAELPARTEIRSPATEEVVALVPEASPAEVDRAVAAAAQALRSGPWPRLAAGERLDVLRRLAAELDPVPVEWSRRRVEESGVPRGAAARDLGSVPGLVERLAADVLALSDSGTRRGPVEVCYEPRGVVALVPYWDSVSATLARLFEALAVGCSVVVRLPVEGSRDLDVVADAIERSELPRGVVSLLPGGQGIAERLAAHPDVDMVAFAGGVPLGRRVAAICGQQVKPVTLELVGTAVGLLAPGCDLARHLPTVLGDALDLTGQARHAAKRILVHENDLAEVTDRMVAHLDGLVMGNPADEATDLGPLRSAQRLALAEEYLGCGVYEGAVLVAGGKRPPDLAVGHYLQPALLTMVENTMTVAQEDNGGPILCLVAYRTEEEAVALANASRHGWRAGVHADDVDHAARIARRLRAGLVTINRRPDAGSGPVEGRGLSGVGAVGSVEGLHAFRSVRSLVLPGR
jgi:aldehyde dehydrogenase (NAD+)